MATKELPALSPYHWSVGEDGVAMHQEERTRNREQDGEGISPWSRNLDASYFHHTDLMDTITNVFIFSSSVLTQKSLSDIK